MFDFDDFQSAPLIVKVPLFTIISCVILFVLSKYFPLFAKLGTIILVIGVIFFIVLLFKKMFFK